MQVNNDSPTNLVCICRRGHSTQQLRAQQQVTALVGETVGRRSDPVPEEQKERDMGPPLHPLPDGEVVLYSGNVSFQQGERSRTIVVPLVRDQAIEPDEVLTLVLRNSPSSPDVTLGIKKV